MVAGIATALTIGTTVLLSPLVSPWAALSPGTERRVALVIGNSAYQSGPLPNPINDARAFTSSLREIGFEVIHVENATQTRMAEVVASLPTTFAGADVGIVFYAGHGVQYEGSNYLLPIDLHLNEPDDLAFDALSLDDLLSNLDAAKLGLNVVFLDACRNNPFGDAEGALGQGLATVERAPGETLIAYAAAAGTVAADGTGPHSPYTGALISALEVPGRELYDILRQVRRNVRQATGGRQLPWVSGSIETQLILRPSRNALPGDSGANAGNLAQVLWSTIQDSQDPEDFALFLRHFCASQHADAARRREAALLAAGAEALPIDFATAAGPGADGGGANVGIEQNVTECDLVAADPDDPARLTQGVPWGLVSSRVGIRVCAANLAADPNNPRLAFQLGRVLDIAERFAEAEAFYRNAMASGYSAAFVNLGYMARTARGRERDYGEAARLTRIAAEVGNLRARTNIGFMYEKGWGVPKSTTEALRWYRLAAAMGWPNAIDSLGNMYRKGIGVEKQPAEALRLYTVAAALGQTNALHNLAMMHRSGDGIEKDIDQALNYFEQATVLGNAYAPFQLGRMYRRGWGVEQDFGRARQLFELSSHRNFAEAHQMLGEMAEKGEGGAADLTEAYVQYRLAVAGGRKQAEARLKAVATVLGPERTKSAEASAELWRRQNGN